MGICANKLSMATEFLKNTKDILIQLPMWMTPGCKVWNVGSIAADNGNRILTDCPSDAAFRGYSCLAGSTPVICAEARKDDSSDEIHNPFEIALEDLYGLLKAEGGTP